MRSVSLLRLYLLRAMYMLIAVGLSLSVVPGMVPSIGTEADSHSVINAMLVAMIVLSLLGLRYPLDMLPILIFELVWKTFWLLAFALPLFLDGSLDDYAASVAFACIIGVVLTPLVIPWRYVFHHYVLERGSRWRKS